LYNWSVYLSDKSINNHCVFNKETPIVHCDSIYSGNESTFMYCGKPYNNVCKFDDECFSLICNSNGFCSMNNRILFKRNTEEDIILIYAIIITLFVIIPISCCCCHYFPQNIYFIIYILFVIFIIVYRLTIL